MSNTVSHIINRGGRRFALNESAGPSIDTRVRDWVTRVVTNGGAVPSANTQLTLTTFIQALDSAGLFKKMITVNTFVPDNFTASMVPILKGTGYDMWNWTNFNSTDLTVDGLKGDGTGKVIDMGMQARSTYGPTTGSVGLSYYIPYRSNTVTPQNVSTFEVYSVAGDQIDLISCYQGTTLFDCLQTGGQGLQPFNPHFRGMYCGCFNSQAADTSSRQVIYTASPFSAPQMIASASARTSPGGLYDVPLAIFGGATNFGAYSFYSPHRISFFATHLPLTTAEFTTFYNLVQAMRVSLGGGYVDPDPVNDWVKKVVYYGGPTPTTGSQIALKTFYNGLVSNNLLNKMKVVNACVSDSLTASLTPFINNTASYDPWINFGFTGSTVNGFSGNGTNYMDTGFVPGYSYTTASDAGLTVYVYHYAGNQTECELGNIQGGSALALYTDYQDTTYFDAYSTTDGVGRFHTANASFQGYMSANQLGSSKLIYTGSSALGHGIFVSASNNTGGTLPTVNMFAMNLNGVNIPSRKTVSFFAIHNGLTPTESSNFYTLIQALRTSLGGGFV